jgi:prepilin-type N-terminal cleavage/methylation domain-containing protein
MRRVRQRAANPASVRRSVHVCLNSAQRGLTLVELLVSMVILGFIMTLVSQAVSQVTHIVRVADDASRQLGGRWSQGWSLNLSLSNLVAPIEGRATPFRGGPLSIEGYTSLPFLGDESGVAFFELLLQPAPPLADRRLASHMTNVLARGSKESRAEPVAVLEGRVEFQFRTRRGQWVANWPPPLETASTPDLLPAAIMLRDADSGRLLMVYSIPASESFQAPPQVSPFGETQ